MDRPLLSLDRAFTYDLPAALEAGIGSLVQVPFHGRAVRGWVLGPTDDVPERVLAVKNVVSQTRWFDEPGLALCRWVSERYVAPLAAVLERATPPRVAAEEDQRRRAAPRGIAPVELPPSVLEGYREGTRLVAAIAAGAPGPWVLRPAPEHEGAVVVEVVAACLDTRRRALVIVPEAAPVPGTARAVVDAFGDRVAVLLGGSKRARYRTWLDVQAGRYDVVVGTRPSVFAPVPDLGLIVVGRESHPALREDRAPYYHVRDVAIARGGIQGAVVVLSAMAPSSEAAALSLPTVAPRRRSWVPVEIVAPGPEGRAPRLVRALRESTRAFLFSPLPGYGVAAVCRSCGQPAACAVCHGTLRSSEGSVRCVVCEAHGRCRVCGANDFGLRRGGQERVEEWAARVARVPVHRLGDGDTPRLPADGEVLVGGPDDVRDLGGGGLDLVAILDADLAGRRPGLTARERAVTTWTEAIAWARPGGRAIVQSAHANDPTIQSLVLGDPARFHRDERDRRAQAGFPVGSAVFRVVGGPDLPDELAALDPITLLVSSAEGQTVCLLALDPGRVAAFGRQARSLAARDVVTRVEAEPHL
ncbi:MAG: primosomal protein N' family DNA-binding protein [Actinomycetota bacterium]